MSAGPLSKAFLKDQAKAFPGNGSYCFKLRATLWVQIYINFIYALYPDKGICAVLMSF